MKKKYFLFIKAQLNYLAKGHLTLFNNCTLND